MKDKKICHSSECKENELCKYHFLLDKFFKFINSEGALH